MERRRPTEGDVSLDQLATAERGRRTAGQPGRPAARWNCLLNAAQRGHSRPLPTGQSTVQSLSLSLSVCLSLSLSLCRSSCMYTTRQRQSLNGFSSTTRVSRYRNVSIPDFVGVQDDGGGGDNWSYKTCKAPVESSPPTNQHPTLTGQMPFLLLEQQCH